MIGTWVSAPGAGWNVIAVPGISLRQPGGLHLKDLGFVLEVIPYTEKFIVSPGIIAASNRGHGLLQEVQNNYCLIYEQVITSNCTTDFCKHRGFADGSTIHKETGMLFHLQNHNSTFPIGRMGIVPHGDAFNVLGPFSTTHGLPPTFSELNTFPTLLDGSKPAGNYAESVYNTPQFSTFNQLNPNTKLQETIAGQSFRSVTHLALSTANLGGILNTPFINESAQANQMKVDYWIERVAGSNGAADFDQLQYSQTVNLSFFANGDPNKTPINWPHVGINTLTRATS